MSLTTTQAPISDKDLVNLNTNLQEATTCLKVASLSLRSCYTVNASSVKEFVQLRNQTTNESKVYSQKILPFATIVVQNIQDFSENYTELTFEQFKEGIKELADDARKQSVIADYTMRLHMEVLTNFKKNEDQAVIVVKKLEQEAKWYQEKAEQLQRSADEKNKWAIGLAFIPIVGAIASPILKTEADGDLAEAIAKSSEAQIAVNATHVIKDALIVALENFIKALTDIAGFFALIHSELSILSNNLDDEPKRTHYYKCQAKAKSIGDSCKVYISSIPDCYTDLQAIPDDYDKNYVQQWFADKMTQIENNQSISFLEWGKKLFSKDQRVLAILGASK